MPQQTAEPQSPEAFALREEACRARRLADGLVSPQDRRTLIDFAARLEASAAAVDAAAAVQKRRQTSAKASLKRDQVVQEPMAYNPDAGEPLDRLPAC